MGYILNDCSGEPDSRFRSDQEVEDDRRKEKLAAFRKAFRECCREHFSAALVRPVYLAAKALDQAIEDASRAIDEEFMACWGHKMTGYYEGWKLLWIAYGWTLIDPDGVNRGRFEKCADATKFIRAFYKCEKKGIIP